MLVVAVFLCALLSCSVGSQRCSTSVGIRDVNYLIEKLQADPPSSCSCSANVTSCLCLPIPSDNCTTPCFQEGLSQVTNVTQNTRFSLIFHRVRKTLNVLRNARCLHFSCEQPCNQTTTGNTVTFLRSLLGTFQKERMRGRKGQI
uniref:Interleukin 9 n=1 Tax=Jaculus jaculus TaxID=51337 RepID=A0A8C5K0M6_JACJA